MKKKMMKKMIIMAMLMAAVMMTGCGKTADITTNTAAARETSTKTSVEMNKYEGRAVQSNKGAINNIHNINNTPNDATKNTTGEKHDKHYDELVNEITHTVARCKEEKNLEEAYLTVFEAAKEYPDDTFIAGVKQDLLDQMPSTVSDDKVIKKKLCNIKNEIVTSSTGERIGTDFDITLGGGNIALTLGEKYSMINLKAVLTGQSPTKAKVDIDIYADGELIYSLEDFDTTEGVADIWLNVEGVDTFIIDSADHDHAWVGEASFSKPDSFCHFAIAMYEARDLEWIF